MYLGLVFVLFLSAIFNETHSFAHHYSGGAMKTKSSRLMSMINEVPIDYRTYEQCRHQICVSIDTYPEKEIKHAISKKEIIQNLFGNVLNATSPETFISSRYNFFEGESWQLCNTEGPVTYEPKVLRNVNLEWKYIVNLGEYKQTFTAELCRNTQTFRRRSNNGNFCTQFGFSCKQDYQDIFLLTYEYGNIAFDKFSIPTTCSCACA